MRQLLRHALLVLLAITLPAYGWASLSIPNPCPMQSSHSVSNSAKSGCCQHSDHGKPAKSCKTGQECQTGTLYQAAYAPTPPIIPSSSLVVSLPDPQLVAGNVSAVWRPPRFL